MGAPAIRHRGNNEHSSGRCGLAPAAPLRRIWAVAGSLLLSGCMVGPDFEPPLPPDVSGYTPQAGLRPAMASEITGSASQRFVDGLEIGGQWWREFNSPQINAFVEEAVHNHPTVRAAQYALRAARETALQTRGALAPQIAGVGSATRQQVPAAAGGTTGAPSIYNLYYATVNVSYTLDVFGGLRRQVESAEALAQYRRFEMEATYLALTANVVTSAISDASLRAQIAASQAIIKAQTDQLQRVQRQFEVGANSQAEVLAQRATLAQTQATLPPLQKQLAQGRNQLMAYLGRLPSQDRGESVNLSSLRLPRKLPVSLPAHLVRQRPDIRQAEATLHQAAALVGVNIANLLPQFTITPSAGTDALTVGQLFTPQSAAFTLAANLGQKLVDGGQAYRTKEASVASFEQDYALYQGTIITAFQNVADALRAVQFDAATLRAQSLAEKAALDSLTMAQEQFKSGAIGYAIIITAQQTYQNAVILRIQAQAMRYADTVALFQALGGGWWHRFDETREAFPRNGGYFQGPDGPALSATRDGVINEPAPSPAPDPEMERPR
ncbi:NodT family efflux transporter outer membrane factor (OMF) lipoprotein [Rhodopseudomonas rhenobacensis]|uniref:NodT family efflux transporter outer membrane factor (OMF) lipoprotein n=1 Tax=Rhodopseudomonas rhenobacensis TaxID=87461 RepID=A0A7W8DXN2_9BRAD|nr:efflux transporter outer membrane subunit [Rhodopseudomonas rhenobacensis]MBB5046068.1 NodT family efflux transporter outer membrane factor (OMF) lipoprotein [Rhodopseudomonas rhenobacensis]